MEELEDALKDAHYCVSFWERLRGLIGSGDRRIQVFRRCRAVHTIGMLKGIDVAFVSPKGEVMKTVRDLKPLRFVSCTGAATTLERISQDTPWFCCHQKIELKKSA